MWYRLHDGHPEECGRMTSSSLGTVNGAPFTHDGKKWGSKQQSRLPLKRSLLKTSTSARHRQRSSATPHRHQRAIAAATLQKVGTLSLLFLSFVINIGREGKSLTV
jgi:hypothetical protein